jgi:O-antigen/teichoic acid export membrane protein
MGQDPPAPGRRAEEAGESAYEVPESLVRPVLTGVKWKMTTLIIREGSRLAIGILLAHLLTPAEWGLAGMALVVMAFLTVVSDFSLAAALVQRPRITEADRSTMFWTSLGIGAAMTILGIAFSGVVADFFGEPDVQPLFAVASLGFFISATEKVPGALLTRELAYRSLEIRQIVATLAGAAAALVLALLGAGPWAIIGNSLTLAVVSTVLLWAFTTWRPRFVFAGQSFRELTTFGASFLGSQLLVSLQINADKLLVGRYLSASAYGNYAFAYQLMFTPIINVAYPLQTVLFPAYATIQADTERLTAAWLRSKRVAVAVMAPAFLVMVVVAPDLVPAVFGSRWDDAIPVLQLLCFAGIAYSLSTANALLLMVKDRLSTLFRLTLLVTVTSTACAAFGLQWGIVGVATAYALAHWALVVPDFWITTRAASFRLAPALRAALSPLPAAFVAAGLAYGARRGLLEAGASAWLRIVVAPAVLLVVYVALAYVTSEPLRREVDAVRRRVSPWLGRKTGKTVVEAQSAGSEPD